MNIKYRNINRIIIISAIIINNDATKTNKENENK